MAKKNEDLFDLIKKEFNYCMCKLPYKVMGKVSPEVHQRMRMVNTHVAHLYFELDGMILPQQNLSDSLLRRMAEEILSGQE